MVFINYTFPLVNDMIFLLFKFVLNIDRVVTKRFTIFYTYFGGHDTKKVEKH